MYRKLTTKASSDGHWWASAGSRSASPDGGLISRTRSVMAMAKIASLNASVRPVIGAMLGPTICAAASGAVGLGQMFVTSHAHGHVHHGPRGTDRGGTST